MNLSVVRAIFKRNFTAYFSNPTGYVFICVFVLLSGFAAFWPHEFFNASLANLDQLNTYFPYIMLIFIPAITMSVWAEEKRQGTDELLLTLPATDLDVVVGKYLAAVAIYTVALLFSVSNVLVLALLGSPDLGLMLANYFGYWLVGLAMLAIGMVASFLTSNLTVGFILGCLFNMPLAFAASADVLSGLLGSQTAQGIKHWSLSDQFRDFGRGVIGLAEVSYFLLIVAVMLYLSIVLIGRRHWLGGRDGQSMIGHYIVRFLALVGITIGLLSVMGRRDARTDLTVEGLSTLSPKTKELMQNLELSGPVRIDAYISPTVPESYVQTRLNLLSTLREFEALAGNKIVLDIHNTEQFSAAADQAEQQFGIRGQQVASRTRGAMNIEEVFMGVAFTHGLDKVVVPFFDRGVPVEYEVARSIATVAQSKRRKLGVLATDAKLYGGFDMQRMSSSPNEQIIEELSKQYEVVQVNADAPITERYDVLLAVQPSSLTQQQMDNFIAAVKSGQPTAIFEDPFPYLDPSVPGTSAPKQQAGGNPFMGGQPPQQPKGDITPLWNMLGVEFTDRAVVWQDYNPYKKVGQFPREFLFVDLGSGQERAFDAGSNISSDLQQMLLLFPGAIRQKSASDMKFEPLVMTGEETGEVAVDEIIERSMFGQRGGGLNQNRYQRPTRNEYVLAAHIQGKLKNDTMQMSDEQAPVSTETAPAEGETPAAEPASSDAVPPAPQPGEVNVVLVTDIDVLYSAFFALRSRGDDPDAEVNLSLDNVTFVLNALDVLAGDERFVDIRKRRPIHRTLTTLEAWTEDAKNTAADKRDEFVQKFNQARDKEQAVLDERIAKVKARTDIDDLQKMIEVQTATEVGNKRLQDQISTLQKQRDKDIQRVERDLTSKVRQVQDQVKMYAVGLPPILPLVLGVIVYFNRRSHEREGVSKSRLR
jgi:ABC-2 type transport system permease protein